ncbi:MAG: hypothetical protein ACLTDR_01780 [Adlercreutzia equolifaciens]
MEEALLGIVTTINNYLSNYILIILLLGMGIWFTVRKAIQFRCFGEGWRRVFWLLQPAGGSPGRRHDVVPGVVHRYHRGCPGGHERGIVGACGAIIV